MVREHCWKLEADHIPHTVVCEELWDQYVIYVDDAYIETVYRKQFPLDIGGLEKPLELFGQDCRFVVWHDQLDFVCNGKMLSTGKSYLNFQKQCRREMLLRAAILLALGVLLQFNLPTISVEGESLFAQIFRILMACGMTALGALGMEKFGSDRQRLVCKIALMGVCAALLAVTMFHYYIEGKAQLDTGYLLSAGVTALICVVSKLKEWLAWFIEHDFL